MYKLTVKQGETESVMEFESAKLARLYRDYHLSFGHWNGKSQWIDESKVTPEMRRFIVDEMTEMRNSQIVRVYRVTDGIELILEEAFTHSTISECWSLFRIGRDKRLAESDWTQVADNSLSQDERKEYRSYRQYLRNLPAMHNDGTVPMAKIYSFENWKDGKR